MCLKFLLFLFLIFNGHYLYANEKSFAQSLLHANNDCTEIKGVFFDLGDTLVEAAGAGQFQLRPGAQQMIDDLLVIGIRLGIITNVPNGWTINDLEAILINPSFLDDFETVILSSQAPAPKPDPAIFSFAYSLLTNPPAIEQMAFVTENLDHIANVEINPTVGARSVGMIGIHFSENSPSPLADYTVSPDDFQTIIEIVDEIVFCSGFES